MDYADWPALVDQMTGLFNQPVPALTATMWWYELRHYERERVEAAIVRVAHDHLSPYLPPLGVLLRAIRSDGVARAEILTRYRSRVEAMKTRTDQFLLERGIDPDEEDRRLEAYYSPGTVCSRMCGGVGTTTDERNCFHCGAELVPDTRPPELGGPVSLTALLEAGPQGEAA